MHIVSRLNDEIVSLSDQSGYILGKASPGPFGIPISALS